METPDTVIAIVGRARLSEVLTAMHRNGFGHLTRVLDGEHSPVSGQIQRLGMDTPSDFQCTPDAVSVVVSAPARTERAVGLLLQAGASQTWLAFRRIDPFTPVMSTTPNLSRERRKPILQGSAISLEPTNLH